MLKPFVLLKPFIAILFIFLITKSTVRFTTQANHLSSNPFHFSRTKIMGKIKPEWAIQKLHVQYALESNKTNVFT